MRVQDESGALIRKVVEDRLLPLPVSRFAKYIRAVTEAHRKRPADQIIMAAMNMMIAIHKHETENDEEVRSKTPD